ncbi:hypothetical protein [Phocaeicola barnesiae]|uniref:hypothetical protein n=1 Tax=Phocaeicola barnesiae TaxID=376804 RepID=UPI00242FBB05|nr:hypothetical protein [Phocaeicola barnesiae]
MEFVRVIKGYDHLWAVKEPDKELDELTSLFERWNDADYLFQFFKDNIDDLKSYFKIEKISHAIHDTFEDSDALEELILTFPYTEELDTLFKPLDVTDTKSMELTRQKARNWERERHDSWLRVYAIRLEPNVYVVTGGAIKLTRAMQDKEHTMIELNKLNRCKEYLIRNGVFDKDSFVDLNMEE